MDGIMQMGLPVLGIVTAAAVTFYAVSFYEIREVLLISLLIFHFLSSLINLLLLKLSGLCVQKSFRDLDDEEDENGGFKPSFSSRERRARRKANKQAKS